uniref:Putative secreted protein n=1 Tax=Anopheles darlingi TaxID=43151 RepID=A0A2M4D747_ANODA
MVFVLAFVIEIFGTAVLACCCRCCCYWSPADQPATLRWRTDRVMGGGMWDHVRPCSGSAPQTLVMKRINHTPPPPTEAGEQDDLPLCLFCERALPRRRSQRR